MRGKLLLAALLTCLLPIQKATAFPAVYGYSPGVYNAVAYRNALLIAQQNTAYLNAVRATAYQRAIAYQNVLQQAYLQQLYLSGQYYPFLGGGGGCGDSGSGGDGGGGD